ncbi:MAG TPA: polyprenyl synthetase family protein, partial [Candidatus Eremiobacteraceae bacterium]|nr:polyprenyl synthetase family protein [Candidatus Eremiobacteraceae bacterium]
GEVKQLRAMGNLQLTRSQYFEIIGKKTAELFASCAEVGSIVALQRMTGRSGAALRQHPVVQALRTYGWAFGMAFQIRDDLLDLTASEAALGKPAGSDLRERKVTLPLIMALESRDARLRGAVSALFDADELESNGAAAQLADVVQRVRHSAAIESAQRVVKEYELQARAALKQLSPSKAGAELEALTHALSEYSS